MCSTWIGSGVVSDLNDLRRVHNLLVSSLDKVQAGKGSSSQLYSESATTMEKLAVLKAWAEVSLQTPERTGLYAAGNDLYETALCIFLQVYVVAMKIKKEAESKPAKPVRNADDDDEDEDLGTGVLPPDSLITLVQPELPALSRLWLAVLRDYALLTLPAEFSSQLPPEGSVVFAMAHKETECWPRNNVHKDKIKTIVSDVRWSVLHSRDYRHSQAALSWFLGTCLACCGAVVEQHWVWGC